MEILQLSLPLLRSVTTIVRLRCQDHTHRVLVRGTSLSTRPYVTTMAEPVEQLAKKHKSNDDVPDVPKKPVITSSPPKQFYRRVLPDACIGFGSEKGKQVFKEALSTGYMEGYFNLAAQFRTQDEPAFCGLSTLVMALNALEVDPQRLWKGVWRWYHEYMLDCCVPIKVVESRGVTLDQMACLAVCNTLNVTVTHAVDGHTEEEFREAVKAVTMITNKVLILSYDRGTLDQTGTGHFSPIAGYHPEKDLVLVLDVARFKYPPYWVPVPLLWKSMQVKDVETGQPRGYMIVNKSQNTPLVIFRISPMLSVNISLETDSDSNLFSNFLNNWNDWLDEDSVVQSDIETWHLAIGELAKSLAHLKSDSLLTTQLDMKCPMSDEHTCVVKTVIENLEENALFEIVNKYIDSSKNIPSVKAAGTMSYSKTTEASEATTPTLIPSLGIPVCSSASHKGECEQCSFQLDLQGAHFLTMILLAWPYTQCAVNKNNRKLCDLSLKQVINTGALLQNEVMLLRQQLKSLLGFMDKCGANCPIASKCSSTGSIS